MMKNRAWALSMILAAAAGCASFMHNEPPAAPAPEPAAVTAAMPQEPDPFEDTLPPEEALPGRVRIRDAVLGAGDQLQIRVFRHSDLDSSVTVPASGVIFVPLAGEVKIGGLSAAEARRLITQKLDRYVVDPQVSVIVTLHRSEKVLVLGEVRTPGVFVMEAPMTALEAIARAGGFTHEGTPRRVILLRPQPDRLASMVLNLERTLKKAEIQHNPTLRRGDVLFVPKSTVTDIDRFARHLVTWIAPIISAESAILLGYDVEDELSNTSIFIGN